MLRTSLVVLATVTVLGMPIAALACKAAGPNTHVGMLKSVDTKAKAFTIIDAETRSPITFLSDEAILNSLKDVKGMIGVSYDEAGGTLRALEVVRY